MASIKPHNGKWRAAVFKKGIRATKVFATKSAAAAWATHIEFEIDQGKGRPIPDKTFGELLEHYGKVESPKKKGSKWELNRINYLREDPLWSVRLNELDAPHFAAWRDRRLQVVAPGTVLRDWNLLSSACNTAVREWKWLHHNPMKNVKRPAEVPPRNRIITQDEIDRLTQALGKDINTVQGRGCLVMLFALETGMRAGEIAALKPEDVMLANRVCRVTDGKTHAAKRDVPLSTKAVAILKKVDCDFGVSAEQIDITFRKAKARAVVTGIHFHDTRHNAITSLSKRFDVLALARVVGHSNIKELMTYYNPSAEELAKKLD